MQADFLALFQVFVRGVFYTGFDAVHLVIDFVVFLEQSREVIVVHFQFVDGFAVLGQFMHQVVLFA